MLLKLELNFFIEMWVRFLHYLSNNAELPKDCGIVLFNVIVGWAHIDKAFLTLHVINANFIGSRNAKYLSHFDL